jgi:hypothetical protein
MEVAGDAFTAAIVADDELSVPPTAVSYLIHEIQNRKQIRWSKKPEYHRNEYPGPRLLLFTGHHNKLGAFDFAGKRQRQR